jgi:hypothetical protein
VLQDWYKIVMRVLQGCYDNHLINEGQTIHRGRNALHERRCYESVTNVLQERYKSVVMVLQELYKSVVVMQ